MGLTLQHFDTRNGQWITYPNPDGQKQQKTPHLILQETLENTLLEAFIQREFPHTDYSQRLSIGHIDESSTPADLEAKNHPNGDVLLLSSGSRLLYGPREIRVQLIDKLNPDRMHNGAYGSILMGECAHRFQGKISYLVIDDSNGENGGYLDNHQAWRLVGDCHGKISPIFSQQLAGTQQHILQFRLGDLEQGLYAKGTLAPKEIAPYFQDRAIGQQVAFVIATSSFKGAGKGSVSPGLYEQIIWLGEKARSQRGEIALSQLLPSYPEALRDFLPPLKEQLLALSQRCQQPRQLAEYYCQVYEARRQRTDPDWQAPSPAETVSRYRDYLRQAAGEELTNASESPKSEEFLYLALKADPQHQRLLATQKISQALTDFIRRDYLEAAVGKRFKFDRGMIIPSKDLKTGEICVPWLEEGEPVLEFRAPFLNHNATRYSINKQVEDRLAPNGEVLKGAICVNDEDYSRILHRIQAAAQAASVKAELPALPDNLNDLSVDERICLSDRLNENIQQINPTPAAIPLVPYESDSERQGRDFDGDCLGVAAARRYPYFSQAVMEKTQPEQLFRPTRKEAKLSFPPATTFEVMAIHMADAISVGAINNSVTRFESLLSELELVENYGSAAQQQSLAQQLIATAQQALSLEAEGKQPLPSALRPHLQAIASQSSTPAIFQEQRQIYRWMIEEGCYQNQVAVDLFKSARQPDVAAISALRKLLYREVDYFKQKKDYRTYRTRPLVVKGHSPVELTAALVNRQFQQSQLSSNPPQQYRDLFPEDYSQQQLLAVKAIKAQYDNAYNFAAAHHRKRRLEKGLTLQVTPASGEQLQVSNYKRFLSHAEAQALSRQPLSLRLVKNSPHRQPEHQLLAEYQDKQGHWQTLGTVCELSRQQLALKSGDKLNDCGLSLVQSLSKQQVQLLFHQAQEIASHWRSTLAADDLFPAACAAWHLCHHHGQEVTNNFVYAAFGDLVLEQIAQPQLQFRDYLVGKLRQYDQVPEKLKQSDAWLTMELRQADGQRFWYVQDPDDQEFHRLGTASEKSFQLPIGTQAQGRLVGDLFTTARLEIDGLSEEIILGNMDKYAKDGYRFRGETHQIVLSYPTHCPLRPLVYLQGQKLGQLDKQAVALFQEHGAYRHISFQAQLQSYGQGKTREIVATTPQGSAFKIEKSYFLATGNLKEQDFAGEMTSLTLQLQAAQPGLVAHLRQEDGSLLPIGEFTRNQKASKAALQQAGLMRQGAEFKASLTSRISAARITIDSESLVYPLAEKATPAPLAPLSLPSGMAGALIELLSHQPTLLHHFQQQWQLPDGAVQTLPSWGLTIALERVAVSQQFWEQHQIPYLLLSADDPRVCLETERGYGVFWLLAADIPSTIRQQIEQSVGKSLSADCTSISTISPYQQQLEQIPCLSPLRLQQRLQQCQPAFAQAIAGLPQKPEIMGESAPAQLQAQRTQTLSPIVKAYLDLAETHHCQGKQYTATWDDNNQMLSLLKGNQLKLLARLEATHWQAIAIPLADPSQANLSLADVEHFQALAPRIEAKLAARRDNYRAWYESAQAQVLLHNGHHSLEQIDQAISLSVAQETQDLADVGKVLSQSDLIRQWRQELPASLFQQRATDYIASIYQLLEQQAILEKKDLSDSLGR